MGVPEPPWPPEASSTVAWMTFVLPEGRSVQMIYNTVTGVLLDRQGSEVYPVPSRWLEPVLGPTSPRSSEDAYGAFEIPQQAGTGSPLWWLLLVVGLSSVGAAVYLQRRFR